MGLPLELGEYAADLAFKGGDPSKGFALFEQYAGDCADQYEFLIMLQILSYAKGPTELPPLLDFLEKCMSSDFEEVRNSASFFTLPRFCKKPGMARERLLPILKQVAEGDASEKVRKAASAGLFLIGEISEAEFHRIQTGSMDQGM